MKKITTQFVVEELLPQGVSILDAPPKYGKSWMALDLCLSVTDGLPFLERKTNKCGCLYLALDDSLCRLKARMNKLLAGREAPAGLYFVTAAHDMDNGLFAQLGDFLREHPGIGLIVVDPFQKVRGVGRSPEAELNAFSERYGVSVLLVRHPMRKKDNRKQLRITSHLGEILYARTGKWAV